MIESVMVETSLAHHGRVRHGVRRCGGLSDPTAGQSARCFAEPQGLVSLCAAGGGGRGARVARHLTVEERGAVGGPGGRDRSTEILVRRQPEFASLAERASRTRRDRLRRYCEAWSCEQQRPTVALERLLRAAGIPAAEVVKGRQGQDPRAPHDGYGLLRSGPDHPVTGRQCDPRPAAALWPRAGVAGSIGRLPLLGEHNDEVLGGLLGPVVGSRPRRSCARREDHWRAPGVGSARVMDASGEG